MKKFHVILIAAAIFCTVVQTAFLFLLPETVPVHYNLAGEIDRYGSRYVYFLFPGFTILMTVFFGLVAKAAGDRGDLSGEKWTLVTALVIELFTCAIGIYYMRRAMEHGESAADLPRMVAVSMGALLVALGFLMPRVHRNSLVGLRTVWSMQNERTWRKSQYFAGISAIVCGAILVYVAFHLHGFPCIVALIVTFAVWANAGIAASWIIARNDRAAGDTDPV